MNLSLKNLSFCYPYTYFDILNNLSWNINDGRLVFLYAPEGGGKTTLLKAVAGRLKAKGEILLDGRNIAETSIKDRNTAYTDHSFMFFENRTVRYNLEYPLRIRKKKKEERRQAVERLGFEDLDRKTKKLLFLERLEVLFLRLSVIKRDIILFDDILKNAGEDKEAACEKMQNFAKNNKDKIILFASGDGSAAELFDEALIYTLDAGKILEGVHINEEIDYEED